MIHVSLLLMTTYFCHPHKPISVIHMCLRYLDRGPAAEIVASCPLYVSGAEGLGLAGVRAAAVAMARDGGGRRP